MPIDVRYHEQIGCWPRYPSSVPYTQAYAGLMVKARETRTELTVADGYIAAITLANGIAVATRAPERFEAIGVSVINPWKMKAA
ncbi:hypothetical protein ACGK9R_08520 [Halomonas sp. HNIBRBA4712]|uniref:hypothetical protein n=1 Tax=Halomonas sp. HNIBRBA4712 TaxID=3373087 RepID=UPI003746C6EC